MKMKNLTTHEEFKDAHFGKVGTKKRDAHDAVYQNFKAGVLIQVKRLELGMTQEELAEKVGTTKSYISKIENNIKEARISTLEKIVELGFGGRLEVSIKIWNGNFAYWQNVSIPEKASYTRRQNITKTSPRALFRE